MTDRARSPQASRRSRVRLSIHHKLIGLMAVMITAIVGFLCVYFPLQQIESMSATLTGRATGYGAMLSTQVRSAVAFADRETAREVLSSIESDPYAAAVVLFGAHGQPLYEYGTPSAWVDRARHGVDSVRVFALGERIAVVNPVQSLEGPRGALVIELSTERMHAALKRVIGTAVAAGAAALFFGIAAASLIARSLARRLRAIARVATSVASGEAPTAAVDDSSSDEIGSLAGAFNGMVEHLQAEQERLTSTVRDLTAAEDALAEVNRELEDRVEARTSELTRANQQLVVEMEQRSRIEMELRQAQKLESVGRLASGIAHEINTPVQFVSDSCHFMRDAVGDIQRVIEGYRGIVQDVGEGAAAAQDARARADEIEDDADVPYLIENMPLAVGRSIEGLERVATIVRAMKEFAYPERKEKALADINHAIRTTLMVSRNEYKYVADIVTEFAVLPKVLCHVGELNQVFLNILVNAAHAIQDVVKGSGARGEIAIRTWVEGPDVCIAIRDTGKGIPADIIEKVFDPFFTTKEVGKGTGQGLAIARSVVVDKHSGKLTVQSEVGRGTEFTISLPIEGRRTAACQDVALAG